LAVCKVGRIPALSLPGMVERSASSTPRYCPGRDLGHRVRHDLGRVRWHCPGYSFGHGDRCTHGHVVGSSIAQQVCQRCAEPESDHGQARHENDDRPRCPGRMRCAEQVVDDLAEHAERKATDGRPPREPTGRLRYVRGQPRPQRVRAVRLDPPTGSVIAVLRVNPSAMPGTG
jgi:hypothetical protein